MIQQVFIVEWNKTAPWLDMQMVEQDLIISRALVAIFSDLKDTQALLRPSVIFNPQTAYELVKKELIEKL